MNGEDNRFTWEKVLRGWAASGGEKLRGTDYAVAWVLATYSNIDGTSIRPSLQTVANGLGMSRSGVGKAVARLREAEVILLVKDNQKVGRPNEYRLNIPSRFRTPPSSTTEAMDVASEASSHATKGAATDEEGASSRRRTSRPETRPGVVSGTQTSNNPGESSHPTYRSVWDELDDEGPTTVVDDRRVENPDADPIDYLERRLTEGVVLEDYEYDILRIHRPWLNLPPSFDN